MSTATRVWYDDEVYESSKNQTDKTQRRSRGDTYILQQINRNFH